MDYLASAFRAVVVVGLPLFGLAFGLIWWALYRGRVEGESIQDLQESIAQFGKRQKDKEKKENVDPALGKWMSFGGGFYGLVALYTWLRIEWDDFGDFLGGLGDLIFRFDISVLINFFIESLMNFVWAISWPMYWLGEADNPWIWIAIAYGGYWLGIRAAQHVARRRWVEDDSFLSGLLSPQEEEKESEKSSGSDER